MFFFGGVTVSVCIIICIVECSIFDLIQLNDDYDRNVRIRVGSHSAAPPLEIVFNINESTPKKSTFNDCSSPNKLCRKYDNETYLIVNKLNDQCQTLNYSSNNGGPLNATFNIRGIHLYGGPEHMESKWPVDQVDFDFNSYVTKSEFYQAIVEPYWLMSNGYYVYVDNAVPLFITQNYEARIFQLIAVNKPPYLKTKKLSLNFTLCQLSDARKAQEHAIQHFLGKPLTIPDVRRVSNPIWSTWVRYKEQIDEVKVMRYAEEIASHGYGGQIEIDDHWERCYGSLLPDENKFPDLKRLVSGLKKLNFRVTIWIHPFVNVDCQPTYAEGRKAGYFVRNVNGRTRMRWWRGNASYVDFTNIDARNWFRKRLVHLRQAYGIDSFKFDGGESGFSPEPAKFNRMADDHPETIVKAYVKMIASLDPNVHTRVARGTQQHAIFVTMMDRDSHWTSDLGLTSVIPQLLQMNVLGYSFVLPDMIGGNFYSETASAELFVRWLQLNVFMPSLQFSVPPWHYGDEVVSLAKKFVDLHAKYSDRIIELMTNNAKSGAPVNPPIWWIAPNDPVALACDSEFLLGEDILVAPVLVQGATSRDIYLPKGFWKDENGQGEVVIKGPIWLKKYKAGLDILPYFQRIPSDKIIVTSALSHPSGDNLFQVFTIISVIVPISLVVYIGRKVIRRWSRGVRHHKMSPS